VARKQLPTEIDLVVAGGAFAVTAVMTPAVGGAGLGVVVGRDGGHLPFKLAELSIPTPAIVMLSPLTSCDDRDRLRDAPPRGSGSSAGRIAATPVGCTRRPG
jgi:hypothetical protein